MKTQETLQKLILNIEKVIVGKRSVIELVMVGLLSKGHVLLEDVPGVGKTMLARALAKSLRASFKRIQFTPDLLPNDITGVSIYNQKTGEFEFKPGPIFANIVLADEVNRTTPRTQSSLLECMQEHKITADGVTHELPDPFFVIATQNPIEFQGTYPLPEAQIDRFLIKIDVGYPAKEDEKELVRRYFKQAPIDTLGSAVDLSELIPLQNAVNELYIEEELLSYIVEIVTRTRSSSDVKLGSSPRGSLALMQTSRALAFLSGRDYVIPSDVKHMAYPTLTHRLMLEPRAIMKGVSSRSVIESILGSVAAPPGKK